MSADERSPARAVKSVPIGSNTPKGKGAFTLGAANRGWNSFSALMRNAAAILPTAFCGFTQINYDAINPDDWLGRLRQSFICQMVQLRTLSQL